VKSHKRRWKNLKVFHSTRIDNVHKILLDGFKVGENNGIYASLLPHVHALQRPFIMHERTGEKGYMFGCIGRYNHKIRDKHYVFKPDDLFDCIDGYYPRMDTSVLVFKEGEQLEPQLLIEYSLK
jgi:hypothetical protein